MTGTLLLENIEIINHSRQDEALLTLDDARSVARFFQVLADPTRVRMLKALADNEWCVSDLTQALGMDQPAVSHQLKYLREMGLVRWTKTGRHVYYSLSDNHLRTNDFFAPEQFPTMTFRSTGIRVEGDSVLLDGDLTLRGVTKPVTITGEFGGIAKDPWGNLKAAASGSTVINRHDFGVSWNAPLEAGGFLLGDQVTITIDAQFALQA